MRSAPKSLNSSIPQNTYIGLGCDESRFASEDSTSGLVAMEQQNVFCESNPRQDGQVNIGKIVTTCNDTDKTVLLQWYPCNSIEDCSENNCGTTSIATMVTPISFWEEVTEESCFDVNLLPPFSTIMNSTTMSYRFTEDPSPYAQIMVENSCIWFIDHFSLY